MANNWAHNLKIMEKLSDLIKKRLPKHNLGTAAKSAEVLFVANKLLEDLLNSPDRSVKAYRLESGNLFIAAENSVWTQELWGIRDKVIKKLQERFGKSFVKKIVIKCLTIE